MAHRAPQDHWRGVALPGPRTRLIAAVICFLLSVGAPAMLLGIPGLTVEGQPIGPAPDSRSLDDPAGLGVTGALPGDPLPGDGLPATGAPTTGAPGDEVPGDSGGAESPGLPAPPDLPDGPLGIPGAVLGAYQFTERTLAETRPGCHLSWSVLAGIGRIESGHARGGRLDAAGTTLGPILGVALNGSPGVAAIADTDRGVLDADTVWDRAVGPMQFIPTSWRSYAVDGNGDGAASPHNIYDATLAAGRYLCAGGGDLADPAQLQAAVFRYNHSATYVAIVLRWAQAYLSGVVPTLPAPGPVPPSPNGDVTILAGGTGPAATEPAAIVQPAPPAPLLATTSPPPPPPSVTTTPPVTLTPPVTTTPPVPPTPPVTTTPTPPVTTTPPVTVTPTPPATPTPTPPVTTTPLATDSSPLPSPLPTPTTTLVAPTPPPPPPAGP